MKQFLAILAIIVLVQLPNWFFVLGRESGGINDSGNENWIAISDVVNVIFSFPIYFFVKNQIGSDELSLIIYVIDLVLIAGMIHIVVVGIKRLRVRY